MLPVGLQKPEMSRPIAEQHHRLLSMLACMRVDNQRWNGAAVKLSTTIRSSYVSPREHQHRTAALLLRQRCRLLRGITMAEAATKAI